MRIAKDEQRRRGGAMHSVRERSFRLSPTTVAPNFLALRLPKRRRSNVACYNRFLRHPQFRSPLSGHSPLAFIERHGHSLITSGDVIMRLQARKRPCVNLVDHGLALAVTPDARSRRFVRQSNNMMDFLFKVVVGMI